MTSGQCISWHGPRSRRSLPLQIARDSRRDYTLPLLAAQSGLRLSEVIGLDWTPAISTSAPMCDAPARDEERCTQLTSHAPSVPSMAQGTGVPERERDVSQHSWGTSQSRQCQIAPGQERTRRQRKMPVAVSAQASPHVLKHSASMELYKLASIVR